MANKMLVFLLVCLYSSTVFCKDNINITELVKDVNGNIDEQLYRQRLDNQTKSFENGLKKLIRGGIKNLLPRIMSYNDDSISSKCSNGMMKYISGLSSVKLWAIRMLDATSKPAAGLFKGTVADFGDYDECLEVELPKRNGDIEFRGKYCAIEARPLMPSTPRNFSMAKNTHAEPLDNIAKELWIAGSAFHYLKFRLGVCIPSICTLEDMQFIFKRISDIIEMDIQVPQCYVKEKSVLTTIHFVVIFILSLFLLICIIGSIVDHQSAEASNQNLSTLRKILICFSLTTNFRRLLCSSKGSEELKALHGLRALSMGWIILGHTYVWINYQLLRGSETIITWFNQIHFGAILNGWMSVEPFFFLSGFLTSYTVLKIMNKTKGRINVPVYILRRYIRLTPPLLLTIGLLFFLPLISSGPMWYERVDPELKACTNYWWTSILYISNWSTMRNICVHPTWYLSADFQLYVISIVFLYALYKFPKLGFGLICSLILACSVVVGAFTYHWDLPPTIQISSGNFAQIQETVDYVHMKTFTHAGPYYVGIILGYLMIKYKDVRLPWWVNLFGWCSSTILCLSSVYGAYRWNIGEPHGPLLTAIYAGLHRTTFTVGVAWVTFACITGHGGPVNKILSWSVLTPVSRLTFMIYLLHSLVMWVRMGSLKERIYFSHYNMLYEYVGNIVTTLILTVPFYLLLEAPLSNLERLAFSRIRMPQDASPEGKQNGHLTDNVVGKGLSNGISQCKPDSGTIANVELMGVKSLDLVQNGVTPIGNGR
ncbi:unnamed protein product [Larinioides sclopetarius]|uniref:Nose resistant-to-fluoxetine protein N-terminal domain-containing protein n=1 Tax=Larinioides sclopetarius TaxID=280406 RepID=A0AAV2BMC2_9ARAC